MHTLFAGSVEIQRFGQMVHSCDDAAGDAAESRPTPTRRSGRYSIRIGWVRAKGESWHRGCCDSPGVLYFLLFIRTLGMYISLSNDCISCQQLSWPILILGPRVSRVRIRKSGHGVERGVPYALFLYRVSRAWQRWMFGRKRTHHPASYIVQRLSITMDSVYFTTHSTI